VLPCRSRFAQQLDAGPSQLVHGCRQVADGEADNRAGIEMLLARIAAAENLDMPSIRKFEDPAIGFRMHQPEAKNMLVEMRQFTAAACSRAAPSKARDLHTRQYDDGQRSAREPPGSASSSDRGEHGRGGRPCRIPRGGAMAAARARDTDAGRRAPAAVPDVGQSTFRSVKMACRKMRGPGDSVRHDRGSWVGASVPRG
jgi:hypothetical protein